MPNGLNLLYKASLNYTDLSIRYVGYPETLFTSAKNESLDIIGLLNARTICSQRFLLLWSPMEEPCETV